MQESSIDYRAKSIQLQSENDFLRSELEEYQFRERNLRKELDIMSQVREERPSVKRGCEALERELEDARSQIGVLLSQKQALEAANRNYQEKVNDLKYHNAELKSLSERTTNLHLKQLEMLRKEAAHSDLQDRERRWARQKEALEQKLESCAEIAKEMEDYYVGEIRKLKEVLKNREDEVRCLTRELEGTRTQRVSQGESAKQCNERWQKACGEMREGYELQIKQLRGKVKFLINKLESQQESEGRLPAEMVQSKMAQSTASIDSFRFTPASSLSSSKEPAPSTRRNTSGVKPAQLPQKTKNFNPLAQRNNY